MASLGCNWPRVWGLARLQHLGEGGGGVGEGGGYHGGQKGNLP